MGVKLNTASGGSVSIEPTNTASNYTLTVPAQTGTVIASDSSGNVGIGTSPYAMAGLAGGVALDMTTGFQALSFNNSAYLTSNAYFNSGWKYKASTGSTAIFMEYVGDISFYKASSGTAGAALTWTEQARITSAGLMQFNSGYGSVATAYGCRAWVNFNGTGTVAIRASGNVSSITDNGTGDYTINFTSAMPDTNYSVSGALNEVASNNGASVIISNSTSPTTSAVRVLRIQGNTTTPNADCSIFCVAIHR
jgi:hypothetical protein